MPEAGQDIYSVVGQSPSTRFIEGEGAVDGVEVKFRIPALNITASVWVAGDTPDPEETQNKIRNWVANAYAVAALTD